MDCPCEVLCVPVGVIGEGPVDRACFARRAIVCAGKLLQKLGSTPGVDLDKLVPFWSSCLPIREDEMEAHVRAGGCRRVAV